MIYHIAHKSTWKFAVENHIYEPEAFNNDGFIHCSTMEQIIDVANRYYHNENDLLILEIDETKLDAKVVYENLEGGADLYPHIYGKLNLDAVKNIAELKHNESSGFIFPSNWNNPF